MTISVNQRSYSAFKLGHRTRIKQITREISAEGRADIEANNPANQGPAIESVAQPGYRPPPPALKALTITSLLVILICNICFFFWPQETVKTV